MLAQFVLKHCRPWQEPLDCVEKEPNITYLWSHPTSVQSSGRKWKAPLHVRFQKEERPQGLGRLVRNLKVRSKTRPLGLRIGLTENTEPDTGEDLEADDAGHASIRLDSGHKPHSDRH